ncbi:MAG: caspase family protein [Fibrobacteraceae bacterium]
MFDRLIIIFFFFCAFSSFAAIPVERYLFAVGANNGGNDRPVLRYAQSDAAAFSKVLVEMGGVPGANKVLLRDPSVQAIKNEFDALDRKLAKKGEARKEILFYYSGHADERGLRIGNELYSWGALRKRIDALRADVKISVIDACGSGAITRIKGGVAVPAFMVDASSDMKGYAFITSSTQDESSQESDRLRGSFFTQSLVSGLRGAGDVSGDGKVTLSEAYQFAFNETLENTQATLGGVQHPSRDMNLAGTGDVVMTDVRSTSAGLVLGADIEGRVFIRDASGALVAELRKMRGRSLELGLAPGKYRVQVERPAQASVATVTLADNHRTALNAGAFSSVVVQRTTSRGDPLKSHWSINLFDIERNPRKGVMLGLFATKADSAFMGVQLSLLANISQGNTAGVQGSGAINYAKKFKGVQLSPTLNIVEALNDGVQVGVTNVAVDTSVGWQFGVLNVVADSLAGGQVGVTNAASSVSWAQIGVADFAGSAPVQVGVVDIAKTVPVQVGVLNIAGNSSKIQVGVMDIAGTSGAQIGVYNIAGHAKERQIGILNICGTCEETPVGLFSIVGNGVWAASAVIDETGSLAGILKFGTAYFYTTIENSRPFDKDKPFREFGDGQRAGLGAGTQFGRYGTHLDLDYTFLSDYPNWKVKRMGSTNLNFSDDVADSDRANYMHRVRFGATFGLLPYIGIVGGISANVVTEGSESQVYDAPKGDYHAEWHIAGRDVRVWPGLYSGIVIGRF